MKSWWKVCSTESLSRFGGVSDTEWRIPPLRIRLGLNLSQSEDQMKSDLAQYRHRNWRSANGNGNNVVARVKMFGEKLWPGQSGSKPIQKLTAIQKLRFRNYDSETICTDSETMAIQKLSRFRNYDSETIAIQKLSRFRNYRDSETIAIQKLPWFRNYDSETITIQKLRFRNFSDSETTLQKLSRFRN